MGKNNDIPLHQRAHFRRIREVVTEIAEYEGIPVHQYDLFNMTAYDTSGHNMTGNNTSYNTRTGGSCFVLDNKYDVFEIPKKSNKKNSPYGEFIFFVHNTSFDYYLLGTMRVSLNKSETIASRFPSEKVSYRNYGKYFILYESLRNNITKIEAGDAFDPGFTPSKISHIFDSYNSRKHAYKTSNHKILRDLGFDITSTKKITDNSKVKVFNKNKKRPGNNKQ
jgi:hypothetical protein